MNFLVKKLEPAELIQHVVNIRKMWTGEENISLKHFTDKAAFIADQVHAGEVAWKQLRKTHTGKPNKHKKEKETKHQYSEGFKQHQKKNEGVFKRKNPDEDWNKPCLNPECKEFH